MKRISFNFILTLAYLIIFSSLFSAQDQTSQPATEDDRPILYEVTEVPLKIESVTNYLKDIEKHVEAMGEGKKFDSLFTEYKDAVKKLEEKVELTELDNYFEAKLQDLKIRWGKHQKLITDWQILVREPSEYLEIEKKELAYRIELWSKTYKNARDLKAPKVLLTSINDINKSLKDYNKRVKAKISLGLRIRNSLTDQNIKLTGIIENIDNAILNRRSQTFIQDVPPIWKMSSEPEDSVKLNSHFNEVWTIYKGSVKDFITLIQSNMIYFLFLFLLILLAVYGLKYFGKELDTESHTVQQALQILNYPFSITFLTILIIFSFSYPDMPAVLASLLRIIALIPVIRILIGITNKILNLPLIGLALIYVLVQIQGAAPTSTNNQRLILLFLTVLALSGEVYLIKQKVLPNAMDGKKWNKAVVFGNTLMTALLAISLLTNILGYVTLAELLLMGTLNTIFITILLTTSIIIINALIFIQLEIKLSQIFNVVRQHPATIKKTIKKIVRLGAALLWISTVLNSFQLRDLLMVWLTDTLTREWGIGGLKFQIGDILLGIAVIWITVLLSRFTKFMLEGEILPRLKLPRGVPGAISAIFSYSIIAFGITISIFAAGIDLDKFTLLAGGLGVGIGFGMQDLVKNFISGLILIFERPIQVGDAVQLDNLSGKVLRIGIRSSVITTWDGAEVVVPNGYLISSKLINWTMSNRLRRIDLKVGVAYDSNAEEVMETLMECMRGHKEILETPKPYVLFKSFGDNAKKFEARCWTSNYSAWINTESELNLAIDKAFAEKGINIAFPQLDLHVKESGSPVKAKTRSKKGTK